MADVMLTNPKISKPMQRGRTAIANTMPVALQYSDFFSCLSDITTARLRAGCGNLPVLIALNSRGPSAPVYMPQILGEGMSCIWGGFPNSSD
jgi:hypothetical protein